MEMLNKIHYLFMGWIAHNKGAKVLSGYSNFVLVKAFSAQSATSCSIEEMCTRILPLHQMHFVLFCFL